MGNRAAHRSANSTKLAVPFVRKLRTSMQVRVVAIALSIGVITVTVAGILLSNTIRDGLFDKRVQQLDREYAQTASVVRETFAASQATSAADIQAQMITMVTERIGHSHSVARGSMLASVENEPVGVNDTATFEAMFDIVTPELRAAALNSDTAMWQSVLIPAAQSESDHDEPGIVFASLVDMPAYGRFGFYVLYSLQPEQETLSFVQHTLALGAGSILAALGVLTFLVTRQAVTPIQRAAATASRLAQGNLEERMTVRGQDEMTVLARSFNDMASSLEHQIVQLERLSAAQRRFVSDVSHELRTPLTTIRMAAELIHDSRTQLDPAAARSAELLQAQLDRFEDLLADLLEISRFDAGAAALEIDESDIVALAERVVEDSEPLAAAKAVQLEIKPLSGPFTADIDARRIERILRNLVSNAIDHAEGKPVQIILAGSPTAVAVVVRDHGVGLSDDQAAHVFDRFWRADPSRARTTGGTGLGLAISLEDARLHRGFLEVWGEPTNGAAFRLVLPRFTDQEIGAAPLPLTGKEVDAALTAGFPANPVESNANMLTSATKVAGDLVTVGSRG